MAACQSRLDSDLQHAFERARFVSRRHRLGDHGAADHHGCFTERLGRRAAETARGGVWTRRDWRWETILAVVLPTAKRGVYGAIILAFGRALGETMALAMLVGNSSTISASIFAPASTLAAMIANRFAEASPVEMSLLMYAALVLMTITLLVNVVGTWILQGGVLAKGLRK